MTPPVVTRAVSYSRWRNAGLRAARFPFAGFVGPDSAGDGRGTPSVGRVVVITAHCEGRKWPVSAGARRFGFLRWRMMEECGLAGARRFDFAFSCDRH
jgi:hypothetical protein